VSLLVMMYDAPRGEKVFSSFSSVPHEIEHRRKLSDSPRALARYRSTLKGFAAFLRAA
jgi:hypothetical protein